MKIIARPQNFKEQIALAANLAPIPLVHSQLMPVLARGVLCAFKFGIFDCAEHKPGTIDEMAAELSLNKRALRSLMNVLTSAGYFRFRNNRFSLTAMARKWCLRSSATSTYAQQMFNIVCWDWMTYMDEFIKTGKGLQYHETFNDEEWNLYQRGMESVAKGSVGEVVRLIPKLDQATQMLDVGGSHGLYSVALCRRYPSLSSTIIDLPEAVEQAKPLLAQHKMGDRVQYLAGNALKTDLEENKYDLVLVSSLIHHFNAEQIALLSSKIEKALKRGGYYVIQEFLRPETKNKMDMAGVILDLFFNLSSTAGNWSLEELINFQREAGLQFKKVKHFIAIPGYVQVISRKQ